MNINGIKKISSNFSIGFATDFQMNVYEDSDGVPGYFLLSSGEIVLIFLFK